MKYTIILLSFFIVHNVFAQTSFEGEINYNVMYVDKPMNAKMTIFFGKPGIRLEVTAIDKPATKTETIIMNFDSSKIFTLMPSEKRYKESSLRKRFSAPLLENKIIAGFGTTAEILDFPIMSKELAELFSQSTLYLSKDLTYVIPRIFADNPELIMVYKNKIVLGGDFYLLHQINQWNLNRTIDTSSKRILLAQIIATKVIPHQINDSAFNIPTGFINWRFEDSVDSTARRYLVDSSMTDADSTRILLKDRSSKKKKSSPNKKPTTTKSPLHRKEE